MNRRALSVLIVDDDPQLGSALTRDLRRHGVSAEHVRGCPEAERRLQGGAIDVLLADLQLGASDGIHLLKRAKKLSARTHTILMSGYAPQEERLRAAQLGAVYLEKPFTPDQFFNAIQQVTNVELRTDVSNLLEILGRLHRERQTATVVVCGAVRGEICLVDGEITHAVRGEVTGTSALCDLLAVPHKSVEVRAARAAAERTIQSSFAPLILRALEQLDRRERPLISL